MPRRTHAPLGTPTKPLANFRRFSYAPGNCAPIRDLSAKTFSPRASRPSGGGDYAAADHFRGRHRFQQLRTGSQGRHPTGAGNRAQHPSRARRGNAAHDRRAPGPGADQRAARSRFRGIPPHVPRLPRPIWRGWRGAGGRPRRPPIVFLGLPRHRKPATAQQSRDSRQGLRGKEAGLLQPFRWRGQKADDRDGRGPRRSRGRGRSTIFRSARRSRSSRP